MNNSKNAAKPCQSFYLVMYLKPIAHRQYFFTRQKYAYRYPYSSTNEKVVEFITKTRIAYKNKLEVLELFLQYLNYCLRIMVLEQLAHYKENFELILILGMPVFIGYLAIYLVMMKNQFQRKLHSSF